MMTFQVRVENEGGGGAIGLLQGTSLSPSRVFFFFLSERLSKVRRARLALLSMLVSGFLFPIQELRVSQPIDRTNTCT